MVTEGQPLSDDNASFLRAARGGNLEKVLEYLKANTDINTCNANGLNALHLASKEGHVAVVEELLARGAKIDAATKKGNTALHIASLAGQEAVVKILVEHGSAVNVQSQNGFTPLYMAAQENHDGVVRFLLASGANQSLATEDGFTPLAVALQQGHDKVVAVLLENDTRGKVRLPALHIAAKKDDTKAAGLLLQSDHNPDVTSKSGFTPLHIAAHYGNENIAALLLQRKANVNYAAKHNITPLHVAAKWGKANMVALLLDKGANLEAKTRDGLTPLHCAARSGHENVVDMMVQRGAPISAKTKNGLAPLHMASQGDHVDAARILLHHKAPVDEVTVDYLTALHVAAHCGHVRVAKLLLDRKADPNSRALNGFTPLHIACKKNRIKVVELLLKYGASIEATTESGLTPLHVASFMGCMNIVIFLIQNQASPDEATVRGETPLHLAARANQTDIIRILLRNGAQVDARAREQQTPLHIASRLGNVDIVVLLLQSGAQVDATTKDLYTALHIAAKEGQEEVASVLLEHKASLTSTTKKGFTPLHLAAKYGNLKVSRLLLEKDAPVDAEGKNGVTPLHVAAHYDHQNVALLLLDKGASPHAAAKNGYTPLHITAKKNQLDIAASLLEYGGKTDAESKAGFTPLHLAAQEGHVDMVKHLVKHNADVNAQAKNGLAPIHLCAQEDRTNVGEILAANGADMNAVTKAGYSPLHVAAHFGSVAMIKYLLEQGVLVDGQNELGYTPLHQAAQQGHSQIVNLLLETGNASPNTVSTNGQTALSIAQRLGYISVVETLKVKTEQEITTTTTTTIEEKYKVLAPESMQETFMSDSEDEGGEENMLGESSYKYLTVDEMKSLGDDSMPIDVTHDEKHQKGEANFQQKAANVVAAPGTLEEKLAALEKQKDYTSGFNNLTADNVDLPNKTAVNIGSIGTHSHLSLATSVGNRSVTSMWRERFLVSFMVDARGGAMRGCRHSGVRVIIPPRKAPMPMRITCRYLKKDKLIHPPPLMEGEAIASRILELGPSGAKFLGPVIIEVPHFAALRGKEREIVILRSDNGETWREHTLEATEDAVQEVLQESFDADELSQLEDLNTNRITRILTTDFPQYFAIVSRIRQEVHAIGPEGGVVNSTVVPQVQAVFPQGALTKKIKVGLQAHPIPPELTAKLLGNRVAVSPIVTVEPRRRKFHKPITLTIPVPQAAGKGMINQYNGETPTLRLLCSITGGTTRAQWEDVTGSTPLHFVNDCVNFTTTVSARFWLMDCRNVEEATKMATELYREAIHVPFMAKFVVFSKRHEMLEARLRVFCMTDDKEEKTLEGQEHFNEIAKSRDVEVLEGKSHFVEMGGNLVPVTKSGDQLSLRFYAFRENRLPFNVRVKDPNSEPLGRIAFMKEPKNNRQESQAPQAPICNLNLVLPDNITPEPVMAEAACDFQTKVSFLREAGYGKFDTIHKADLKISDIGNLLGPDWVKVAHELEIPDSDINIIKSEYPDNDCQQAMVMLRFWLNTQGNKATGNSLERALRKCDREDIVNKCIFNVELVTDESEKHAAEEALDLVEEADEDVQEEEQQPEFKQVQQEEIIIEKMEKMTFESGTTETMEVETKESALIFEQEEKKYSAEEKEVKQPDLSDDEQEEPSKPRSRKSSSSSSSSEGADDDDDHKAELVRQSQVQEEQSVEESTTDAPEESTEAPDESIDVLEESRESPVMASESPEPSKDSPVMASESPEPTRESPVTRTETSEATRESPEPSRESPVTKSESPEPTRESPVTRTETSEATRESPEPSRESPVTKSESPEPTRESPVTKTESSETRESPEPSRESPITKSESPEPVRESPVMKSESPEPVRESPEPARESPVRKSESPEPIRQSPEPSRESPVMKSESPEPVRESPVLKSESPELSKESPEPARKSPDESRESPVAQRKVSRSSSESSSSSEEGGQVKQATISSSEVDTTDASSSKLKDSSVTESSKQAVEELRQDTLEELDEEQKQAPTFQIQHATEQEVEQDDFYQVQHQISSEDQSEDLKEVAESKTPPPSPVVKEETDQLEGAEPSLEEAVAVATQELSLSATQESSTTEAGLIQSDDDEDEAVEQEKEDASEEVASKEEETSSPAPPSPTSTTNHSIPKSILANTTLKDEENESSMEYKEIATSSTTTFRIDQESFVTKHIHETMSDEEQECMESSNLINEQVKEVKSVSTEDMAMIKQVATDFVKTLSEEALEIVKDKMTPDKLQIPTLEITFPSDVDLYHVATPPEEPVSRQFQFQTSFRAHFVMDFDGSSDQVDFVTNNSQVIIVEDASNDDNEVQESDKQVPDQVEETQESKSSNTNNQMMESSEDIWAGEDAVMLRKSKTTYSVKSNKTDSESASSEHRLKSDRMSGTDHEWSSSDPYHTAHGSRPSSSDVEVMLSAVSGRDSSSMTTTTGDFETANSQSQSSYHTAANTLSSRSGHLASFEVSETSDTLIDISIEPEEDREQACTPQGEDLETLPHDDEVVGSIVRSPEMFFQEDKRENLTGSVVTISSGSENTTTILDKSVVEIMEKHVEVDVMSKSTTSTTSSENKAIISGEILSSAEELKKDPEVEQHHKLTRVVSFDTANIEMTSNRMLKDQKASFDSDFGSRPESELKDFESRPHSISEAMLGADDSRPDSKEEASDTEMEQLKKNLDPFQRPDSPEPPLTDNSPMDEKTAKTEMAFSTHFTQVIEDEEYEKLVEVPEYQIMTAVEVEAEEQQKLRSVQSLDLTESTTKPLSSMVWPASDDLNQEDDEKEPVDKTEPVNIEDNWEETDELITRDPTLIPNVQEEYVAYVPPLDQIIEEEEEVVNEEAQLKELANLKESLSSTPEFEMLDKRALSLKLGEKDNSSLSSLQEFETLEQEMIQHGSGSGSRNSLGSQDSLELAKQVIIVKKHTGSKPGSSHGSSGSLQEFEQMEDACKAAESVEYQAKHQETVLSEIEEGHESQISESDSCETLSQGGKSDDSAEFTQRMHQIDEIIRQAQTNVETFADQPQQYLSCIMEASTDSLDQQKLCMVTSTDSLEDKLVQPSEDLMKISTDSIELSKAASGACGAGVMIASTDSLESGNVGKSTTVTTSQCMVSYGFNVSEVILPREEGGLVSTIERTVEMPAEVTKIQFKGPDAEVKMKEYVQSISGGKSLQEVESVDASGNVIHKRVIQQRLYSEEQH